MKQSESQAQPTKASPVAKEMTPEQQLAVREFFDSIGPALAANLNRNVLKERADVDRASLPAHRRILNWLRSWFRP